MTIHRGRFGRVLAVLATGTLVLAGCGADPSDGASGGVRNGAAGAAEPQNKITGSVGEWFVDVSATRAYAGDVMFAVTNYGTTQHEFLVVKTDIEPGKITLGDDNRFDEELDGIEVIDEIAEFEVNTTGMLKVALDPGAYQLLCNIAGHYSAGMYTGFEVVEGEAPATAKAGDVADTDAVSNDIKGSLAEWNVNVDAVKAYAGDVKFDIENRGSIDHEFLVVKTTYDHGKIPIVEADKRFSEEDPGITVIDEIKEYPAGQRKTLSVNLDPGTYELLCNIEGHYGNGMHVKFEVVDAAEAPVKNEVTGSVDQWGVHVDAQKAMPGDVTFTVTNKGDIAHEFLVVKTTYAPGKIPVVEADKRFSEEDPGLTVVDEIPEWAPGETKTLKVGLEAGRYELVCNIEEHYANGMYIPFVVG